MTVESKSSHCRPAGRRGAAGRTRSANPLADPAQLDRLLVAGFLQAVGQRILIDGPVQAQQLLDGGIPAQLLKMGQPIISAQIPKEDQPENLPVWIAAI
ncbi:MAG: hypothetical protein U5K69_21755 [Balneolaceae bacterium]|nr:hypothetical protein [Balneolaceae bacterium]